MRKMLELWVTRPSSSTSTSPPATTSRGSSRRSTATRSSWSPSTRTARWRALTVINLNHVVVAYYDETPPDSIDDPVTEAVIDDDGTVTI